MAPLNGLDIAVKAKRFPAVGAAAAHLALQEVHLKAGHGEFICLLGPSGCGKTTLLNIIAGLDRDFEGQVTLPAIEHHDQPVLGYVFQEPRLLPWRTVAENVELVLSPAQCRGAVVDELLAATGLQESRDRYPERLSLGMSRRASLARAFAVEPDVLLLDEPFVSLDESTAHQLRAMLLAIWQQRPTTVIFVTHNTREAIYLAQRIVLLSGPPGRILTETRVPLSRAAREDPAQVETFRAELLRDNPALQQGL